MKKTLLITLTLFTFISLNAQFLDTVRIQATGMDGTVAISSDDAEQINNEIDKLYDDDLDMGWEGDEFNVVITGLRFRNVNVPKGAVIDSAFIEIFAHEDEGDPALLTIWGEASDNAETYNETDLITARPKTNATVAWNCDEEWAIWEKYRTPELKTIIQEIVNRPNWQAGNALAIVLSGQDQGASADDNARDFESLENVEDPDDGGDGLNHPERIPKLYVYYSTSSSVRNLAVLTLPAVIPNPVKNGNFQLDLSAFDGQNVTLHLLDQTGKTLNTWNAAAQGTATFQIPGSVAAGMYQLEVLGAQSRAVTHLLVH